MRDIYEVPAAAILLTAHKELEQLVGTIHQNQFKPQLDHQWAYLVYAGLWWEPLRDDLDAYMDAVNEQVTGTIGVKLYKGSARVVTRESPERGLRRGAGDVRRVGRAVLPAGVAGLHRALVAAVAAGVADARARRRERLTAEQPLCDRPGEPVADEGDADPQRRRGRPRRAAREASTTAAAGSAAPRARRRSPAPGREAVPRSEQQRPAAWATTAGSGGGPSSARWCG